MYQRTYEGSDEARAFKAGEYTVPANYRGNVFTSDEIPGETLAEKDTAMPESDVSFDDETKHREKEEHHEPPKDMPPVECGAKEKGSGGLLSGLLSGIGRDIELDDIILIGLIILMLIEKKKDGADGSDDIMILLALLLIVGF